MNTQSLLQDYSEHINIRKQKQNGELVYLVAHLYKEGLNAKQIALKIKRSSSRTYALIQSARIRGLLK